MSLKIAFYALSMALGFCVAAKIMHKRWLRKEPALIGWDGAGHSTVANSVFHDFINYKSSFSFPAAL